MKLLKKEDNLSLLVIKNWPVVSLVLRIKVNIVSIQLEYT